MSTFLPPVKPGEVITSNKWNQVIDAFNVLLVRVNNLETSMLPQAGNLTILDFNPKPVPLGGSLTVFGTNFGLPGEAVITVDGAIVPLASITQATSSMLVFNIPAVQNVPSGTAGKQVTMTISHAQNGFDSATITVVQAAPTIPTGTLAINMTQPPADPLITANAAFTYIFTITAISTMTETFLLTPFLTNQPTWNAAIVNESNTNITPQVEIPRGDPPTGTSVQVRVRVTIPGGVPDGTVGNLRLRATARRNAAFTKESPDTTITVNQPPEPPDPIDVTFASSTGVVVEPGSVVIVPTTQDPNDPVLVTFEAVVPQAGSYTIDQPVIETNPGNLWSADFASAVTVDAAEAGNLVDFTLSVRSNAGAQPTRLIAGIHLTDDPAVDGQAEVNIRVSA